MYRLVFEYYIIIYYLISDCVSCNNPLDVDESGGSPHIQLRMSARFPVKIF
jgi:hypothetical protein